ncbi:hypothetical protein BH09BAC1_BH09BAC1_26630 [soil metagenome]
MKTLLAAMLLITTFAVHSHAQQTVVTIAFVLVFRGEVLELDKQYFLPAVNDSVSIETLRFYISDIMLVQGDKEANYKGAGYYLIDAANPASQNITLTLDKPTDIDAMQFSLGIDSVTNVSGAMGGALDPMHGMYWAWQSGYINFKLEGNSAVCSTRNHLFQYHIGGYSYPFNSLQSVLVPVSNPTAITVYIHLDKILAEAGLATTNEIMSPNAKAMQFAAMLKSHFTTTLQP